jgi:hypothetical protein
MALLGVLVAPVAVGEVLVDLEQQIKDMLEVPASAAVLDKEVLAVEVVADQ